LARNFQHNENKREQKFDYNIDKDKDDARRVLTARSTQNSTKKLI